MKKLLLKSITMLLILLLVFPVTSHSRSTANSANISVSKPAGVSAAYDLWEMQTQAREEFAKNSGRVETASLDENHSQYEETDRFIIKYKSSTTDNASSKKRLGIKESFSIQAEDGGQIETIVLSQAIDVQICQALLEEQLGSIIDYIQPDYAMYFSSVSLMPFEEDTYHLLQQEDQNSNEQAKEQEVSAPSLPIAEELVPFESSQEEPLNVSDESIESREVKPMDELKDLSSAEMVPLPEADTFTHSPVLIAVIDSGMDVAHPDIAPWIYENPGEIGDDLQDNDQNGYVDDLNGWNFVHNNPQIYDASSAPPTENHGTQVGGIIAGVLQEAYDDPATANVRILPLKAFHEGIAYTSDILSAISYAKDMGASVVNASFGCTHDNPALEEAIAESGMLFITASGNERSDLAIAPVYPASYTLDNLVSVASTNADGGLSFFSNYSDKVVHVAAPGRDIMCPFPGGRRGNASGTSMSAAHVSGIAAVAQALHPNLSTTEVRELLFYSADQLSNLNGLVESKRRVNLENILQGISGHAIENHPADDFDVRGSSPTTEEAYALFSTLEIVDIAAGWSHTLALASDGTVWEWGDWKQYYGLRSLEPSSPSKLHQVVGLTDIVKISVGAAHNLALKSDGTVWGWGKNGNGQISSWPPNEINTPVQLNNHVIDIDAGYEHSLFVYDPPEEFGEDWMGLEIFRQYTWHFFEVEEAFDLSCAGVNTVFIVGASGNIWGWRFGDGEEHPLGGELLGNSYDLAGSKIISISAIYGGFLAVTESGSIIEYYDEIACIDNPYAFIDFSHAGINSSTLHLTQTGEVWARNQYYPSEIIGDMQEEEYAPLIKVMENAKKIAAGFCHDVVLDHSGMIWGWGSNHSGQLGDGYLSRIPSPIHVNYVQDVKAMAAAYSHNILARTDGSVYTWGSNYYGELGNGTTIASRIPHKIGDFEDVEAVYALPSKGGYVLTSDGTVWGWGPNGSGQLGNGTFEDSLVPVQVQGLTGVKSISIGGTHVLALKNDGTVWSWGNNYSGQLGDATNTKRNVPVRVANINNIVEISAGDSHSLALQSNGAVYAWGSNSYGALGDGTTIGRQVPTRILVGQDIQSIKAVFCRSLALRQDGTVLAWGMTTYGHIGHKQTAYERNPVEMIGDVVSIAASDHTTYVVKRDGSAYAWGHSSSGTMLGGGATSLSYAFTPVKIKNINNVRTIFPTGSTIFAITEDGTVWAWGMVDGGGLGNGSPTHSREYTPKQLNNIENIKSIINGSEHSFAIAEDGRVYGWGYNQEGQVGIEGAQPFYLVPTPFVHIPQTPRLFFLAQEFFQELPKGETAYTLNCRAVMRNQIGEEITDIPIAYAVETPCSGVSIDENSGEVTITSEARPGEISILAQYDELTAAAVLKLIEAEEDNNSAVTLHVEAGKPYHIALVGSNITSFADNLYLLQYDDEMLEISSMAAQTGAVGVQIGSVPGVALEVITHQDGQLQFCCDKTIPEGKAWSGVITIMIFEALQSGETELAFS